MIIIKHLQMNQGVNRLLNKWTELNYHRSTIKVSKVGDHSQGRPEGSLFNSYYTKV